WVPHNLFEFQALMQNIGLFQIYLVKTSENDSDTSAPSVQPETKIEGKPVYIHTYSYNDELVNLGIPQPSPSPDPSPSPSPFTSTQMQSLSSSSRSILSTTSSSHAPPVASSYYLNPHSIYHSFAAIS